MAEHIKVKVKSLSRVRLFATPWTAAYQAPPSMGFSRQEYWIGLPFPSPEDLPNPGIEPVSLPSSVSAGKIFTTIATWEALTNLNCPSSDDLSSLPRSSPEHSQSNLPIPLPRSMLHYASLYQIIMVRVRVIHLDDIDPNSSTSFHLHSCPLEPGQQSPFAWTNYSLLTGL